MPQVGGVLGLTEGNAGFHEVAIHTHLKADAPPDVLQEFHEQVLGTPPVEHTIQRPVALRADLAID